MDILFLSSYCVSVLAKKAFQLLTNPTTMMEGGALKIFNIRYVCRSIFVSLGKAFRFGKLSGYSNSYIYILRKTNMEKCLKIFLGIFFRPPHCSNGTKRRLDSEVTISGFCTPKSSCKISGSLICI